MGGGESGIRISYGLARGLRLVASHSLKDCSCCASGLFAISRFPGIRSLNNGCALKTLGSTQSGASIISSVRPIPTTRCSNRGRRWPRSPPLTKRVRIGILVSSNTFRAPALLAKEAVTVDHISHGRLEFGIGAGGFEAEHGLWGIAYPDPKERVDRLVEAIQLFDHLMRNEAVVFNGRFNQIDGALFRPGPVQRPRPPITLGAHGPRMLKIVAQYADRWNSYGTVAEMRERNTAIDAHCAAIGRDPREIIRSFYVRSQTVGIEPWASVAGFHEIVTRYRAAGIDEFIFEPPQDDQWAMMDTIVAEEIPALRAATR